MNKSVRQTSVVFEFAHRADVTLSRHTADLLTIVLLRKEALKRRLKDPAFCQELVDYSAIGLVTIAAGALTSLVSTYFFYK